MRRLVVAAVALASSIAATGAVFERFLSPEEPMDRVIMKYMELEKSGKATSMDLANLGVLILEKGFVHDAEDYLRKALALDKKNYEAAYRLGLVLQRDRRDREAVRYYRLTLKQRPGYAQARFMLALAEERCGRREAAILDYARAYRHAPDLANPRVNPLVFDSRLQTEAMIEHYRDTVASTTLQVTEVDPDTVKQMLQALAPEARPAPAVVPQPSVTVQPVPQGQGVPAPQPPAQRRPVTPGELRMGPPPTPTAVPPPQPRR